jgi:hypothetical protein
MGKVYSNSSCNIAATSSSSSKEGCFRERTIGLLQPTIVMSSWKDHTNHDYHIYDKSTIETHFRRSPLLERSWVLQEYFLSGRFVHFADQVFWECRELYASEEYTFGLPQGMTRSEPSLKSFGEVVARPVPGDIYRLWTKIVNHYSHCKLTVEKDKLVAISAIAKILQPLLDDVYIAGLWKKQLLEQLLWYNIDESGKIPLPKCYRAPSWSWASVNSAVIMSEYATIEYPEHLSVSLTWAKVLETYTEPLEGDATGEIKSGFIQLRGPLATVVFEQVKSIGSIENRLYVLGKWIELDNGGNRLDGSKIIVDHGAYVYAEGEIYQCNLHFMPVRYVAPADPVEVHGLLLQPVSHSKGHFRRFGVLQLGIDTLFNLEALRCCPKPVWFEYEESHGMGEYTVTII